MALAIVLLLAVLVAGLWSAGVFSSSSDRDSLVANGKRGGAATVRGRPGATPVAGPNSPHGSGEDVRVAPPRPRADTVADASPAEIAADATAQAQRPLIDTDGDGLYDWEEDKNENGGRDPDETDPFNPDTDGDRWGDGLEVKILLTNPLDPNDPGELDDGDADGLPTIIDPNDANKDTDSDRYADGYEAVALDIGAVTDPARNPPIGDVNNDGGISNVDALIVQGVFLGLLPAEQFNMERGDVNLDMSITNIDALALHSFFMGELQLLPSNAN